MLQPKLPQCLSKVCSLITLQHVKQLYRLHIKFSWTENILLINAASRLCVSDCVCELVFVCSYFRVSGAEVCGPH